MLVCDGFLYRLLVCGACMKRDYVYVWGEGGDFACILFWNLKVCTRKMPKKCVRTVHLHLLPSPGSQVPGPTLRSWVLGPTYGSRVPGKRSQKESPGSQVPLFQYASKHRAGCSCNLYMARNCTQENVKCHIQHVEKWLRDES